MTQSHFELSTKDCFKCGCSLPRSEFYGHPKMADGLLGKCKSCTRADVSANRSKRVDYYRECARRRFREDPVHRASVIARAALHYKDSPSAYRARVAVNNAVRDGKLAKGPCEKCGDSTRVHGHHDDYNLPLQVRWLCVIHHHEWHSENGEGKNK